MVRMPKQAESPLKPLLAKYFVALQQARFHDNYLYMKMTAVGHMLASPAVLFSPGVVGRLLWFLITDKLKIAPSRHNGEGARAAGNAVTAASNKA